MEEKIMVKSKPSVNYLLIVPIIIILGGALFCDLMHMDSILYCFEPWALSFYYVWPSVVLFFVGLFFCGAEIVITDKRVYGKALLGQRVDLPLDSISAVGTFMLNGVSVSTSSGRIRFAFVKNRNEIYECVGKLLIERQSESKETAPVKSGETVNSVDELKKYKELLDADIITQEEFDAKKKQLLGL